MNETTIVPAPAGETPSAPPAPALPPGPRAGPPSAPRTPFRLLRACSLGLVRGCLALPRCLLRYPGRSLAVGVLLALIVLGTVTAGLYLWAGYHRRTARLALERYHTSQAIPHLKICLRVWPRDAETLLLAARAARRMSAFDDADRYLDQYQAVRGPDDEALILERVLLRAERGEPQEVHKFCQALVDQDHPATPLILEALARGYLNNYRLYDAEKCLRQWRERQPDNPQALFLEALVADNLERRHDAVAAYRRTLEADPEMDDARLRLAGLLVMMGLGSEALPHLEYLQRRHPDNLSVRVSLARSQDQLGHPEEAEKVLDEVLARAPNCGPALTERGKLALRAGQSIAAERWLRQAVEQEPGDYQAHYQLYLCLDHNGKPEEARKEQVHLKRVEEDVKRIQEIVTVKMQQAPHDASLHYEAGTIALRAGAVEQGLRWLHRALKEDPQYAPAHRALMEHYQRVGDADRAAQHRALAEERKQ